MFDVKTYTVGELTSQQVKRFQSLTKRQDGCLMYDLTDARYFAPDKAKVLSIEDEDGRILSWALLYPRRMWVGGTHERKLDFEVYTRVSERRKGYAKLLYDEALKLAHKRSRLVVHPHDVPSISFFDKVHYKRKKSN